MPFQKGNKFGQGRPPILDKELQSLMEGKREYMRGLVNKYMAMSKKELAFITEQQADDMPLVESWVMKIVEKGHNDNDSGLLVRLWELANGPMNQPEALTTEQRLALSLYEQWKREQSANLGPPRMAEEPQK